MKKYIVLIVLLASVSGIHAQKMPQDYFDEGIAYVDENKFKEAIASFKYIVENYPKNKLYPLSLYNVAYLYGLDKDYDNAIIGFEKILNSDFNETDLIGGSIMDNPYANYKYKACQGLCAIYVTKQDYNKALQYLILSDEKYPFLHFCGNAGCSNETGMALSYADLYTKTGQPDKALVKLLERALSDNEVILNELKPLLAKEKNVKKKLDKAIKNIYKVNNNGTKKYYMKFLDAEIYVGYDNDSYKFNEAEEVKRIKETAFYKMVESL